ncbi:MAG: DNA-directed RNA polymerase subunit omega [Phycisphaerales bacterium]|nr:MAG: DNA-directed RNA polymerase subunit omega [Phycisphaerales bacterium]
MIAGLQDDQLIHKFGGRFKLTALIQRRWLQLMQGARPMVPHEGLTPLEVVVQEIAEGKLELTMETPAEAGEDVEVDA